MPRERDQLVLAELVADELPQNGPEHSLVNGPRVGLAVLGHESRHQRLDRLGRYHLIQLVQDQPHVGMRIPDIKSNHTIDFLSLYGCQMANFEA